MQSFGIRFGEGFDDVTIFRMMQAMPKDYDYDFVVIGSNPGGVACAREARLAGKKTAIITWKSHSPAEAEGFDEDLNEMASALDLQNETYSDHHKRFSSTTSSALVIKGAHKSAHSVNKNERTVRHSRLDMNNELFKRGQQCRKLMHNAVRLGDLVNDAYNGGWRLTTTRPPFTLNWNKMSEEVMDYVMSENWTLATELGEESVEIIEGWVEMEGEHTVKVLKSDLLETEFTADVICLALPTECIFPEDVEGAKKYGISCDDFIRLSKPPGKTLVVGSLLESMECAGIIAGARFPVTIVSRSKILNGYDSEISQMIINDLKNRGVEFKEGTNLISVESTQDKKLLATFESFSKEEELEGFKEKTTDSFDTVLFAVGRKPFLKNLDLISLGIDLDPFNHKIRVNGSEQTSIPNIYAVGEVLADRPEDFEISQLTGKLLGKRLFHGGTDFMNYSTIPTVMYTPTEYAFIGISEDAALYRLGKECVEVYYGYFRPLDYALPPKKGECFAKVIVRKTNEEIIGLHFYGPEAGEIIQGFTAAMRNTLTLQNFRTVVGVTASKAQDIFKIKGLRTETKIEKESDPNLY